MSLFQFMQPRSMERKPGRPGHVVVLGDNSASMRSTTLQELERAVSAFYNQTEPRLTIFAFAKVALQVWPESIGNWLWLKDTTGVSDEEFWSRTSWPAPRRNTCMAPALAAAASQSPQKTIVFSDGDIIDKRQALRIADGMCGDIDVYFCRQEGFPGGQEDPVFMQELARRGRGRFVVVRPGQGDIQREMAVSLQQHIHVLRGTVVHHHYRPVEHRRA